MRHVPIDGSRPTGSGKPLLEDECSWRRSSVDIGLDRRHRRLGLTLALDGSLFNCSAVGRPRHRRHPSPNPLVWRRQGFNRISPEREQEAPGFLVPSSKQNSTLGHADPRQPRAAPTGSRPETAGELAATIFFLDDVEEFLADALDTLERYRIFEDDLAVHPAASGDRDEQADLGAARRHADRSMPPPCCRRRRRSSCQPSFSVSRQGADHRHDDEPPDDHLEADPRRCARSRRRRAPGERVAISTLDAGSIRVLTHLTAVHHQVKPWRANRHAQGDDRSSVAEGPATITPLSAPMATAITSGANLATITFQPYWTENITVRTSPVGANDHPGAEVGLAPDHQPGDTECPETPSSTTVSTYVFRPLPRTTRCRRPPREKRDDDDRTLASAPNSRTDHKPDQRREAESARGSPPLGSTETVARVMRLLPDGRSS